MVAGRLQALHKLMENGNFGLFVANGKRKQQLPFVSCTKKRKTEFRLSPANGNGKRKFFS
jgi:hypothetical protein